MGNNIIIQTNVFDGEIKKNNVTLYGIIWWEEDTRHLSDMKIETTTADTEADDRAKLIYLMGNKLVTL